MSACVTYTSNVLDAAVSTEYRAYESGYDQKHTAYVKPPAFHLALTEFALRTNKLK